MTRGTSLLEGPEARRCLGGWTTAALLAAALLSAGCGQKGPLMLPGSSDTRDAEPGASGPSSDSEDSGEDNSSDEDEASSSGRAGAGAIADPAPQPESTQPDDARPNERAR
jgi:predicted small lipoprotein YifL